MPPTDSVDAIIRIAVELFGNGEYAHCIARCDEGLAKFPSSATLYKIKGAAAHKEGNKQLAFLCMRKSVELNPKDIESLSNYAVALKDRGYLRASIEACRAALAINPNFAQAHCNLANTLVELNAGERAAEHARRAIALRPNYGNAYQQLGSAYTLCGRLTEALDAYAMARSLGYCPPELLNNIGETYRQLGDFTRAEQAFREAIQANRSLLVAYSNLLFSLNYRLDVESSQALSWARAYNDVVIDQVNNTGGTLPQRLKRQLGVMRLGFVSGDLRNHPVAYFLRSLVEGIEPTDAEIFFYHSGPKEDDLSRWFQGRAKAWRSALTLSDRKLAEQIYADEIDVLIDLSGHTAHNRLPAFAYRPAPVQCSWMGYFATTGLQSMDYFIGDAYVAPSSMQSQFVETLLRLPHGHLCFSIPEREVMVSELPSLQSGFVTFGCFNNLAKVNAKVVETWAQILRDVPSSRLLLMAKQLGDSAVAEEIAAQFVAHGIEKTRLTLLAQRDREDYLRTYQQVDIGLDPFPFPGGTTTMESLWMGVPVVTLVGETFVSRNGYSILKNLGLDEWITYSTREYVDLAVQAARATKSLIEMRRGLRDRLRNSPLMDGKRFAQDFLSLFRQIFRGRGVS